MEQNRLRELEDQCIQECAPPCTARCPAHVDVRAMCAALASGDFASAYKTFTTFIPFPEIIARTCDQPCQVNCYRETRGGPVEVAALELACVQQKNEPVIKPKMLPRKNARVAVVGAGLSGLTAAYDLSKKGYHVSLFEAENHLGGRLWRIAETDLPREVIERESALVLNLGVEVFLNEFVDGDFVSYRTFDAWFFDVGEHGFIPFDLKRSPEGTVALDEATLQTSQANVFALDPRANPGSTIHALAQGRRAAVSIDRFLQNVSLTAARENEGAYDTRLVTNIAKIETAPPKSLKNTAEGYTQAEAISEAGRCLQCDCMECVKVCEYLKQYGSYPKKYVREIYNNLSIIMRARTANKMINSCTLCGLCKEVCPTGLNMAEVIRDARQTMVRTAKMPPSAHDFALRDMAFSNSERFAVTLTPNQDRTCANLFFPGCQLSASNPDYVFKVYETLSTALPGLGVMLGCCGAPADWSGEQDLFSRTLDKFRTEWQKLGEPRLVLACTSCKTIFEKAVPGIATVSIWELFAQHDLYPKSKLNLDGFVIHDPCTSRHDERWQNAVREGLSRMGVEYHELEMSRDLTECCGYGGVTWLANPELVSGMLRRRAGEDDADFLTYCVMCRDLLAKEGKPSLHLLDLVYGAAPLELTRRKGPDYSQRHENRARVKQKMMKVIAGKDEVQVESYEQIPLILTDALRDSLERRMILVEDVQKVIEHAEKSGEFFMNQKNRHALAYFKPNLITYWVEYSKKGESYEVHDAYSHRMNFAGGVNR